MTWMDDPRPMLRRLAWFGAALLLTYVVGVAVLFYVC